VVRRLPEAQVNRPIALRRAWSDRSMGDSLRIVLLAGVPNKKTGLNQAGFVF
jgi:hypothetical protein